MNVDMTTTYLGLRLSSPIVPSASTLGSHRETLRRLEEAGAGAIVLPSLFEEQIEHDEAEIHRLLETGRESNPEATTYFPDLEDYNTGPDEYLRHLERTKGELGIPVIASLNGSSDGGWVRYAGLLEAAGADALELNVYLIAADASVTGTEIERRVVDLVSSVRSRIRIPLAVKLAPTFSSIPDVAARVVAAGADGLVLFNRMLHPDIDLESLTVEPTLHLSTSEEVRLPLRWIGILRGRVEASLAATTGIHTWEDAVKVLLAGADVAMVASTLYRNGPEHLTTIRDGVAAWLEEHGYAGVQQATGSLSQANAPDPAAFERANYVRALTRYSSPYDWRGAPGSVRA